MDIVWDACPGKQVVKCNIFNTIKKFKINRLLFLCFCTYIEIMNKLNHTFHIRVYLEKKSNGKWYVSSPDMDNLITYYNTLDEAYEDVPVLVTELIKAEIKLRKGAATPVSARRQPILQFYPPAVPVGTYC